MVWWPFALDNTGNTKRKAVFIIIHKIVSLQIRVLIWQHALWISVATDLKINKVNCLSSAGRKALPVYLLCARLLQQPRRELQKQTLLHVKLWTERIIDFQLFAWFQKDCWQTKHTGKNTLTQQLKQPLQRQQLVLNLCCVIYFENIEDKEQPYHFGMTKAGSGTDTQFIMSRKI